MQDLLKIKNGMSMGISSEHVVDGVEMKGLLPLDMADSCGFAGAGRRTLGLESSLLGRSLLAAFYREIENGKASPHIFPKGGVPSGGRCPGCGKSLSGRVPRGVLGAWGVGREHVQGYVGCREVGRLGV